jgi:hypothetical protein
MVMPRSRSRSFESITRSIRCWCAANVPDWRSSLSTSVVLPWSTWAMMAMLRMARPGLGARSGGRAGSLASDVLTLVFILSVSSERIKGTGLVQRKSARF